MWGKIKGSGISFTSVRNSTSGGQERISHTSEIYSSLLFCTKYKNLILYNLIYFCLFLYSESKEAISTVEGINPLPHGIPNTRKFLCWNPAYQIKIWRPVKIWLICRIWPRFLTAKCTVHCTMRTEYHLKRALNPAY